MILRLVTPMIPIMIFSFDLNCLMQIVRIQWNDDIVESEVLSLEYDLLLRKRVWKVYRLKKESVQG